MEKVIRVRRPNSEICEYDAYGFKFADFTGCEIVSGDGYFVEKAIERGAKAKPKKSRKSE